MKYILAFCIFWIIYTTKVWIYDIFSSDAKEKVQVYIGVWAAIISGKKLSRKTKPLVG